MAIAAVFMVLKLLVRASKGDSGGREATARLIAEQAGLAADNAALEAKNSELRGELRAERRAVDVARGAEAELRVALAEARAAAAAAAGRGRPVALPTSPSAPALEPAVHPPTQTLAAGEAASESPRREAPPSGMPPAAAASAATAAASPVLVVGTAAGLPSLRRVGGPGGFARAAFDPGNLQRLVEGVTRPFRFPRLVPYLPSHYLFSSIEIPLSLSLSLSRAPTPTARARANFCPLFSAAAATGPPGRSP